MGKMWDDNSLLPVKVNFNPDKTYDRNKRKFQGIPGIAVTSNLNIWVTWYSGGVGEGPDNYVTLARSCDGGESWVEPVLIIDPNLEGVRAFDPAIWCDPLGRLWLFWAQEYTPLNRNWDGRAGVWCIICDNPNDDEPIWSDPRRIADGIMLNKPCVCKEGNWIFPVSVWPREPLHPDVEGRRLAGAVSTSDQGKTFHWVGGAEIPDRIYDEHHIYETADGNLVLLARTKYMAARSVSTDWGKTWPPAVKCDIPCPNSRFNITRLKSGKFLMVNHKTELPEAQENRLIRNNLSLWISDDEGNSWKFAQLIDERTHVAYPDADQSPDGTIYVVYDYDRFKSLNIMLAKLKESEVGNQIKPVVIS